MSLENFETELLNYLKTNNANCIQYINNNKKLIDEYYNSNNNLKATYFVCKLNTVILELSSYKLIDKVLSHPLFSGILNEFRQSDIMIRACQNNSNKKLVEWLLTKNISPYIQDEFGKTALMYAAQHYPLFFAVEKFLKYTKKDFIHITDNDGNTALFYGLQNKNIFNKMLKAKFDIHHINNNNENLLLYCCRIDKYQSIDRLLELNIDGNLVNNIGKTAAMYLVENKRFYQLKRLVEKKRINVNYKNKFGETLVSTYIKSYYKGYSDCMESFCNESNYLSFKNYASTFVELIKMGCDFNVVIDDDGNTPIIFFLLTQDYVSANYLLDKSRYLIDLSIKNKLGINASLLSSFLNEKIFDSLEYQKSRNKNKISLDSLKSLLSNNSTFENKNDDANIISMQAQYRYKPTNYTILVQQWYLEILYPNCGAVIKHGNYQLTNSNGSYFIPSKKPINYY